MAFRGISLSGRPLFPHLGYRCGFSCLIGTFSGSLRILSHLAPGHHGININVLEKRFFGNCVELDPIMFYFEAGSGQKPCQSCVFKVAEGVRAR